MSPVPPVGRVVATELKPSTPHQFHFWTARDSAIGIGAIVRVEEDGRTVYGVVTDGFAYSDLHTALDAVIGDKGERLKRIGTEARQELERLWGGKVFLELWVKVRSGWSDDEARVRAYGYE